MSDVIREHCDSLEALADQGQTEIPEVARDLLDEGTDREAASP